MRERFVNCKFVLLDRWKYVYKGGNIEVIKPLLEKHFKTEDEAELYFIETLGSGSRCMFELIEDKSI